MARATAVTALANARLAIAAQVGRGEAISDWLAGEVRARGVRECAAVFAAMEAGLDRDELARFYRQRYPHRSGVLDDVLEMFDSDDAP